MSSTALLGEYLDVVTEEPPPEHGAHDGLRALYRSVLDSEAYFDEFKRLLAVYEIPAEAEEESPAAADVRGHLNARIRDWIGSFEGLTVAQTLQWREIIVDHRVNIAITPWKESNLH